MAVIIGIAMSVTMTGMAIVIVTPPPEPTTFCPEVSNR